MQRRYFEQLADLAMGDADAPADCQTVAAAELAVPEARLKQVLAGKAQLDTYTRTHLDRPGQANPQGARRPARIAQAVASRLGDAYKNATKTAGG